MRHKEYRSFRIQLLKELQALEHPYRLRGIPKLEDGSLDTADRATVELEKDLFFQLHEREDIEIGEIYKALGRMEEGSFGVCEECGRRIVDERLLANPMARLCIECQKVKEQKKRRSTWNGKVGSSYWRFSLVRP
jgi:DnaK suppressor protein